MANITLSGIFSSNENINFKSGLVGHGILQANSPNTNGKRRVRDTSSSNCSDDSCNDSESEVERIRELMPQSIILGIGVPSGNPMAYVFVFIP